MRCLNHQWECGGVPADDVDRLARILGASIDETRALWLTVRSKFRKHTDGLYWNARLEVIRGKGRPFWDQKRQAGKARASKAERDGGGRFRSMQAPPAGPADGPADGPAALVNVLAENAQNSSTNSRNLQRPASLPLPVPDPVRTSDGTASSISTALSDQQAEPIKELPATPEQRPVEAVENRARPTHELPALRAGIPTQVSHEEPEPSATAGDDGRVVPAALRDREGGTPGGPDDRRGLGRVEGADQGPRLDARLPAPADGDRVASDERDRPRTPTSIAEARERLTMLKGRLETPAERTRRRRARR